MGPLLRRALPSLADLGSVTTDRGGRSAKISGRELTFADLGSVTTE
jgi:hypothetical protein